MEPEAAQRQLFAFVKRVAQAQSRREPAVVLLEDLHWFDGGSEAFLEILVEAAAGTRTSPRWSTSAPSTTRPGCRSPTTSSCRSCRSGRRRSRSCCEISSARTRRSRGSATASAERTGGNPFFIEEVVQALAEAGSLAGARGAYRLARPSAELTLPATVQAVLAARIDRLEERDKHVLQTAAVIGKEFSEPVLKRVVDLPEAELTAALAKLIASEFIYEQALYPELEYTFKHALTQEVAYGSLLVERRQAIHERTAEAIEALFGAGCRSTTLSSPITTATVGTRRKRLSILSSLDSGPCSIRPMRKRSGT